MPYDDKKEIRKAMYNLDEHLTGDSMEQEKQKEINYTVKELKREEGVLGKMIDGLRMKRGGVMEEMDSAHFDFKKTVVVRMKNAPLQGFKFAIGFWLGTIVFFLVVGIVFALVGGTTILNFLKGMI